MKFGQKTRAFFEASKPAALFSGGKKPFDIEKRPINGLKIWAGVLAAAAVVDVGLTAEAVSRGSHGEAALFAGLAIYMSYSAKRRFEQSNNKPPAPRP